MKWESIEKARVFFPQARNEVEVWDSFFECAFKAFTIENGWNENPLDEIFDAIGIIACNCFFEDGYMKSLEKEGLLGEFYRLKNEGKIQFVIDDYFELVTDFCIKTGVFCEDFKFTRTQAVSQCDKLFVSNDVASYFAERQSYFDEFMNTLN